MLQARKPWDRACGMVQRVNELSEEYGVSYTGFAQVYDRFMDNVPYREWADFLIGTLEKYGVRPAVEDSAESIEAKEHSEESAEQGMQVTQSIDDSDMEKTHVIDAIEELTQQQALAMERSEVLDLGCGTGTLTELLDEAGYDMIGIDNAEEMLNIAMGKRDKSGRKILYLLQDMRAFELYGTVGAVISVCDSLNYILEKEELKDVFALVNNYLYPGGIFIFDFNTVYKYETVIGDATIAENREECSFIWDNYYHEEERINEYDLTIFVRENSKNQENLFRKYAETHYQRGYALDEMTELVKEAGLEFLEALDADTHEAPTEESERIYVVARECEKQIGE